MTLGVALELGRAHSALGAALAVWVGARLAGAAWHPTWLAPMAVAFLLSVAGNAWNDAHDLVQDRVNRPNRPLPRGAATPAQARRLALLCMVGAALLALPLGAGSALGTALGVALLIGYTARLRAVPLLGNAVVGLLAAMALGYGGLLADNVAAILRPAAALALLFGGREVLKTIHDMPGDAGAGLSTLALLVGPRGTLALVVLCWGAALALLLAAGTAWAAALLVAASAVALGPLLAAPQNPRAAAWALRASKVLGLAVLAALALR